MTVSVAARTLAGRHPHARIDRAVRDRRHYDRRAVPWAAPVGHCGGVGICLCGDVTAYDPHIPTVLVAPT
ncbi:hypothetical protein [Streptomyces sp. NPDC002133]|uniref:hypothetical protein n=1 Tax=Streptomyces sp. NPDC002133 TaxID=3154409 RepID=UPI00331B62AB